MGTTEIAKNRAQPPGVCLLILSIISLPLILYALANGVYHYITGIPIVTDSQSSDASDLSGFLLFSIFIYALILAAHVLMIRGSWAMISGNRHGLALSAAIVSLIPCLSPFFIFGIPFGLWALLVLTTRSISQGIERSQ